MVTGAYQNVLSGKSLRSPDRSTKKTQRVAWKIGSNNTVIETGLQNLTQDVASCLLHFGPGCWLPASPRVAIAKADH
jgi:hypothetical protein